MEKLRFKHRYYKLLRQRFSTVRGKTATRTYSQGDKVEVIMAGRSMYTACFQCYDRAVDMYERMD